VPNYQQIDRDPQWHRWLSSPDPLTGRPRQLLLNNAIASGDASRVSALFRGLQQEAVVPKPFRGLLDGEVARQTYTLVLRSFNCMISIVAVPMSFVKPSGARQEEDIIAAAREGRVQGAPYLTK